MDLSVFVQPMQAMTVSIAAMCFQYTGLLDPSNSSRAGYPSRVYRPNELADFISQAYYYIVY